MRAKYIGTGFGMWKGLDLEPGREFDIVPDYLQEIVLRNENFEVLGAGHVSAPEPKAARRGKKSAPKPAPVSAPKPAPVSAPEPEVMAQADEADASEQNEGDAGAQ